MSTVFFWIGVIHAAFYAIIGTLIFVWWSIEKILHRLHLKRELIRALAQYYKNKRDSEWNGA